MARLTTRYRRRKVKTKTGTGKTKKLVRYFLVQNNQLVIPMVHHTRVKKNELIDPKLIMGLPIDRDSVLDYGKNTPKTVTQYWVKLETNRVQYDPTSSPYHVGKATFARYSKKPVEWTITTDEFSYYEFVESKMGIVIGNAMKAKNVDSSYPYVIKRKGATSKMIKELIGDVINSGVFSFFNEKSDYALAQLVLGDNIMKKYDLTDLNSQWEDFKIKNGQNRAC